MVAHPGDHAGDLVTEHERLADLEVADAALVVVVQVAAADAADGHLHLDRVPVERLRLDRLDAQVVRAVRHHRTDHQITALMPPST